MFFMHVLIFEEFLFQGFLQNPQFHVIHLPHTPTSRGQNPIVSEPPLSLPLLIRKTAALTLWAAIPRQRFLL
jgi:hypothetical protein